MNRWCISVACMVLVIVAVVHCAPKSYEENLKTIKRIDIDQVLGNERIIRNYVDCILGKKRCTSEGNALKESWKDGLDKGCEDCDEEDKRKVRKILKHMYTKHRDLYDELAAHLDKDGKYRDKYQAQIDDILKDPTL